LRKKNVAQSAAGGFLHNKLKTTEDAASKASNIHAVALVQTKFSQIFNIIEDTWKINYIF
jgi:hypothetical protein